MAVQTGPTAVPGLANSLTIPVSFASGNYTVVASANWNTVVYWGALTATSFILTFSTPAPAGGGQVDWTAADVLASNSGVTAVANGATSVVVLGNFPSSYNVTPSANWNTTISVGGKTTTQFTLTFGTPAPANAQVSWVINALSTSQIVTLGNYLTFTRELLRAGPSGNAALYADADLTDFINRAMQQRDIELGLNRARVRFSLTTSVFDYAIATIIANGTVIVGPTSPNVVHCVGVIVTPLGSPPSGIRYPLGRLPFSQLSYLLSTSFPTYPRFYAPYGVSDIAIAPPPANAYPAEFDFMCFSSPLVATSDQDQQGYPYTDPIPFLAASFAKLQAQRFDEAKEFLAIYRDRLNMFRARTRPYAVKNPWFDLPRST